LDTTVETDSSDMSSFLYYDRDLFRDAGLKKYPLMKWPSTATSKYDRPYTANSSACSTIWYGRRLNFSHAFV